MELCIGGRWYNLLVKLRTINKIHLVSLFKKIYTKINAFYMRNWCHAAKNFRLNFYSKKLPTELINPISRKKEEEDIFFNFKQSSSSNSRCMKNSCSERINTNNLYRSLWCDEFLCATFFSECFGYLFQNYFDLIRTQR